MTSSADARASRENPRISSILRPPVRTTTGTSWGIRRDDLHTGQPNFWLSSQSLCRGAQCAPTKAAADREVLPPTAPLAFTLPLASSRSLALPSRDQTLERQPAIKHRSVHRLRNVSWMT